MAKNITVAELGEPRRYRLTFSSTCATHTRPLIHDCSGCACKCHGRAEKRGTGYIPLSERDYA